MSLVARNKGGADFAPIPAGMHHAVCYQVVDLGTQPSYNPNFPPREQVCFTWELPEERIEVTREGSDKKENLPRSISAIFTTSLHPKSKLLPMLESWRGRKFTPEELDGFHLEKVLGQNCLLNVVHADGKDKEGKPRVYANVSTVSPLMKGTAKRQAENPLVHFSFDDFKDKDTIEIPETIPEWIANKIRASKEWQEFTGGTESVRGASQRAGTPSNENEAANLAGEDDSGDVPF